MGFCENTEVQEYWSGLPCPSPRDLPDPGTKRKSPALQADSLPSEPPGKCRGRSREGTLRENPQEEINEKGKIENTTQMG